MRKTLHVKERECYNLQNELKEAKRLLNENSVDYSSVKPTSKPEITDSEKSDSEFDANANMLTNIQQQLEALASDRRRGDQVNTYKDEVRKIGEKYRASQKRESLLVKEKAQLVVRINKLEADLEH